METIQFKDENLKIAILHEMKKQHLIDQSAQDITEDDALKVGRLDLFGKLITSIEGLEKFKNLETLHLDFNCIASLKPLAALAWLTELLLNSNHISDLTPLAGLTNLETLHLHNNYISDIKPLAGLINLEWLTLYNNRITDLFPGSNQVSDILQRAKTEEEFFEAIEQLEGAYYGCEDGLYIPCIDYTVLVSNDDIAEYLEIVADDFKERFQDPHDAEYYYDEALDSAYLKNEKEVDAHFLFKYKDDIINAAAKAKIEELERAADLGGVFTSTLDAAEKQAAAENTHRPPHTPPEQER